MEKSHADPFSLWTMAIMNSPIPKAKAIVLGGGLAGMSAAWHLRHAGFDVHLFEARSKLGGRAGSFVDASTGQTIDYCQHVGMGCCTHLVDFIQNLGVQEDWDRQHILHFYGPQGEYVPLSASAILPAPSHLNRLLLGWPGLTLRQRFEVAYGVWRLMRIGSDRRWDSEPALPFLQAAGQSPSTIERFWTTILVSALGEEISRVAVGPMRKVIVDGFLAHRKAYEILVPKRPLREIFSDRAKEYLQDVGIQLHFNRAAKKLLFEKDRCTGAVFSDQFIAHADLIVIALPWFHIVSLGSPDTPPAVLEVFQRAAQLESSPITGVHLWFDRPWLKQPHAAIVGRLCQWVFRSPWLGDSETSSTDLASTSTTTIPSNHHHYQVVISASRQLPRGDHEAIAEAVMKDLTEIFPEVAQAKLTHSRVVTDPNSVFSVAPDSRSLRPTSDALFANHGIALAGDWTDTSWPATMEGALRSGFRAAKTCADQFQLKCPEPIDQLPRGLLARFLIR
jgi:squalene-associated FAD-dependent desaturase